MKFDNRLVVLFYIIDEKAKVQERTLVEHQNIYDIIRNESRPRRAVDSCHAKNILRDPKKDPLTLFCFNLDINPSCHILSKAFTMSRNIAHYLTDKRTAQRR